jgi:CubicO group peptidase (beta-lactamase class C family)
MPTPLSLDLLDARLRPLCDAYLCAAQVPGASIAVVAADRGYHYAYGVKSVATREPVTAQTSFNIGSCSKAFTSATVASLVAEGLVAWDDPISKYVPEFQLYDPWVTSHATLRDLGSNRLGLPRAGLTEFGMDPQLPQRLLFESLRHTAPQYPFRDRCTYVNHGHTANAVAAGRVTGKGFLATLRERILEPLGMSGTSGGAAAREELPDQAAWHVVVDGQAIAIDTVFSDQSLGTGGMVVSGLDAIQWLRLHLNEGCVDGRQVIARAAIRETHRPHSLTEPGKDPVALTLVYPGARMGAYALGWAASDFEGHPLIVHSGSDYGVTAFTLLLPRSGIGITVYGNSSSGGTMPAAYGVAATLLGLAPRDWAAYFASAAAALVPPAPLPEPVPAAIDLGRYVGVFAHPADGELVIERDGEQLHGRLARGYRMDFDLEPVAAHRFRIRFRQPEWRGAAARQPAAPQLVFEMGANDAQRATVLAAVVGRTFDRTR